MRIQDVVKSMMARMDLEDFVQIIVDGSILVYRQKYISAISILEIKIKELQEEHGSANNVI